MTKGTKSVLFGAHCFFLHPFFVFVGWWKLYGFPYDPRLWLAFFLHDLGYIGKKNMDDEEGEKHPFFGANIMGRLFGEEWYWFTLLHSRFLAKKLGKNYSKLCVADKYAICLTPSWLYIPMTLMSGEIHEYIKDAEKNSNGTVKSGTYLNWHKAVKVYVKSWVDEHKDLKEDNWTSSDRKVADKNGVWK